MSYLGDTTFHTDPDDSSCVKLESQEDVKRKIFGMIVYKD